MHRILLIVPAFNEEDNIVGLISRIRSLPMSNVDILIINDCSSDRTGTLCENLGVEVINLPCNLGIGGAVQTGYKFAKENGYSVAVQIDGDGQHNPSFLRQLIEPIISGDSDMVIGSRYIKKEGFQSTFMRRLGINYFSKMLRVLTGQIITDPTSGFRACNEKVIDLFSKRYPIDYPEPESIMYLKRNELKIKEIPVTMYARVGGNSSITSIKSIYYMTKVSLAILIDSMRKQIV
ncbi:glycosyltransferase family 2 protein [Paenibacillus peoriae]|uniref:glycosyltransferase family 2 protein n=1 Tax=Paenibacillus peoriae TaxID=59893 RepID=UPI00096CAD99|nr:glycosyltransferase family 2 protein [Paenibacillus peoriae]OMF36652.1 glycosyl transferase family 2 [Paenibacillus peoriae]